MSKTIRGTILHRRRYSEAAQMLFARLSGDHNPIHVDHIASRRTLTGERVVHGIHLVLTAMEGYLRKRRQAGIAGFTARFLKPVLVGESVAFYLTASDEDSAQITGVIADEAVCKISFQLGASSILDRPVPGLPIESVMELDFDQCARAKGRLALGLDSSLASELFPISVTRLGSFRLAEILALSRLVGMHCPGLHSLFSEASIQFIETQGSNVLVYEAGQADERFGRIVLRVEGPGLKGDLQVFFRPPPRAQPKMAEIAGKVKQNSFAQSVALVVGGSRGLGEVTAKIIAAGGGFPIITYYQGAADARRVVEEIRGYGGQCDLLQLDVQNCRPVIRQLSKRKIELKSLYYFATSKIFGQRRDFFCHEMLEQFLGIYVTCFGNLLDAVAAAQPLNFRVFYPSSVAVTEGLREMSEYAMAKRMSEEMCAFYNRYSKQIEIMVERLPRTKTDQTSTLIPSVAQNAIDVMLPIIRRMETVQ